MDGSIPYEDERNFLNLQPLDLNKNDFFAKFVARKDQCVKQITRVDLNFTEEEVGPEKMAFQLFDVLSAQECDELILLTESAGYRRMPEYPIGYRSNTRVIINDQKLCGALYDRVKSALPQEIVHNSGRHWDISGLNEQFRFCKYVDNQHFSAHYDANFTRSSSEKSQLTFMIYLRDVPVENGGATRFFDESVQARNHLLKSVQPKAGMVLVFSHKIYHDGQRLDGGQKYLMRSDVMYKLRPQ